MTDDPCLFFNFSFLHSVATLAFNIPPAAAIWLELDSGVAGQVDPTER